MGSSAKKKKDKKKDFQKPKLRVGKAKAKPDNFTDTSFKSKSIVLNQQSLTTSAPSTGTQLSHNLSLLTSKSDTQRRDALAHLTTTFASSEAKSASLFAAGALPSLLPLMLDGSSSVRSQLLKILRLIPEKDIHQRMEAMLLYIRAGMTHLAVGIRDDTLNILEYILSVAGDEVVSAPGGWVKTLRAFAGMMGWSTPAPSVTNASASKWTSAPKATFGRSTGVGFARQIVVLAQFLQAGLRPVAEQPAPILWDPRRGVWHPGYHDIPKVDNAYAHLNIFGAIRDEEGQMYTERDSRQRVYAKFFQEAFKKGAESAKKEGGELGRAAATLYKVLEEGMEDYEDQEGASSTKP